MISPRNMYNQAFKHNGIGQPGAARQLRQSAMLLTSVALFWSVSSWGYYQIVKALALDNGYDERPVLFAGYYLLWSVLAMIWSRDISIDAVALNLRKNVATAGLCLCFFVAFFALILPQLPPLPPGVGPKHPPDFMLASSWYYLPKAADILFQQVLIASLILTGTRTRLSLKVLSFSMAVCFGGYHLMLNLEGFSSLYVTRFTLAAIVFGSLLPWLYLRVKRGPWWAYGLHLSAYGLDAIITRLVLGE